jgi:hypothetical protein
MAKYVFTPEMDQEIQDIYAINIDSKPRVINFAEKFNMPRWTIYQRALKIGAVQSSHQKKKWEKEEIRTLKKYARYEPLTIRKKLSEAGFHSSIEGIVLKRKRMRLLANLDGMSA